MCSMIHHISPELRTHVKVGERVGHPKECHWPPCGVQADGTLTVLTRQSLPLLFTLIPNESPVWTKTSEATLSEGVTLTLETH